MICATSLGLGGTGLTSGALAQQAVQLDELSVAGLAGSTGRAGQGVGLLRDLPAPYAGGQFARGGSLGILDTRDALNTQFSTVTFTQQVIQDQQARTAADTLVNDASVRLTTASNGFSDTFQIRGFEVQAQDVGLNGLYGLVSSNRVAAQYIERIELLKGPGAFMYGIPPGGSVGGSINIVTKRALDVPFVQVTPQYIPGSGRRPGASRRRAISEAGAAPGFRNSVFQASERPEQALWRRPSCERTCRRNEVSARRRLGAVPEAHRLPQGWTIEGG